MFVFAVRRPNEAMYVKPYGTVGQVEPVLCNIRDDASVAQVMQGADAVINCVGILARNGMNTFEAVQADGATRGCTVGRRARYRENGSHLCDRCGCQFPKAIIHKPRLKAKLAFWHTCPNAIILRPSVVFGTEDEFFNRFAGMTRMGPVLPLVGAETKFQPVSR